MSAAERNPKHSFFSPNFDPEAALTDAMVSVPFPGVKPLDNLPACRRLLPSSAVDHVRPEDDRTRRAGSHHANAAQPSAHGDASTVIASAVTDAGAVGPAAHIGSCSSGSAQAPPQRRPRLSALFHQSVAQSGSGPLGGAHTPTDRPMPPNTCPSLRDASGRSRSIVQCFGPCAPSASDW